MANIEGRVALVTGASSGIGMATVAMLLKRGAVVYAAARRVERMRELEAEGAKIVGLDMTDEGSIVGAVDAIKAEGRSVGILVNNAGYGSYGAIEDVPLAEARRQLEVNLFGLARLTQLLLPEMRSKRYGKIVNISSMGGKVYTPFGGWYHATKHALEGFSDCLRLETKPFGIDVIVVEPGGIKTDWGAISAENLKKTSGGGAYAERANRAAARLAAIYASDKVTDPSVIARLIVKAVCSSRPKSRYAAGYMARASLFVRKWFGDRVFDAVVSMMER